MLYFFVLIKCFTIVLACNPENTIPINKNSKLETHNVSYFLYTRRNNDVPQKIIDQNVYSLNNSYFDRNKDTKIIVHGWLGKFNSNYNLMIKNAFLKKYDVNVIIIDWSKDADRPCEEASKSVPEIGKILASFVDWLIKHGSPSQSFHIVGFSLGAQIAGAAGRRVQSGKIGLITGLDPSKRFFENTEENISFNDASYVEIIHTDKNDLGISFPRGNNDFYPNYGESQPGCKTGKCSHARSYEYFVESILSKGSFVGERCLNYEEILSKNCSDLGKLEMGGSFAKKTLGVFYLKTNAESPYSKQ